MNYKDIVTVLNLVKASEGMTEFTLECDEFKLRMMRNSGGSTAAPTTPAVAAVAVTSVEAPPPLTATQPATSSEGLYEVRSPSLGVFYAAPSPDAPSFVTLGQQLEAGAVLGLVEVMKLYTDICLDKGGQLVEICVEDGALIQFDQVIMRVRLND